jgi:hypothetical protein
VVVFIVSSSFLSRKHTPKARLASLARPLYPTLAAAFDAWKDARGLVVRDGGMVWAATKR